MHRLQREIPLTLKAKKVHVQKILLRRKTDQEKWGDIGSEGMEMCCDRLGSGGMVSGEG